MTKLASIRNQKPLDRKQNKTKQKNSKPGKEKPNTENRVFSSAKTEIDRYNRHTQSLHKVI